MSGELIVTTIFGVLAYIAMGLTFLSKLNTAVEVLKVTINSHKDSNDTQFQRLEQKQDKHNNLIERMVVVEESSKSAHHRINEIIGEHK